MPIYDYKCQCGRVTQRITSIAEYRATTDCEKCGQSAERFITSAPAVRGDYPGYVSPATGQWVEGRKAHQEDLARSGCRVYEPGEKESMMRRQAAEASAMESAFAETAAAAVEKMSGDDRAALGQALESGADVKISRQTA